MALTLNTVENAWKLKIDPCLDVVVKSYLSFIREHKELLGDGNFGIKDEYCEYINGHEQHRFYVIYQKQPRNIFEYLISIGLIDSDFMNIDLNVKVDPEKAYNDLMGLLAEFPKESREFYIKHFTAIRNGAFIVPVNGYSEKGKKKLIKKNTEKLSALICSLIIWGLFEILNELMNEAPDEFSEGDDDFLKNPVLLSLTLSLVYNNMAEIAYQRTVSELLAAGDDNSLLKAICIDKSLLYLDVIKDRLTKAHNTGDVKFIGKMGKALAKKPLENESLHYETYLVLKLFWKAGLSLLKKDELYYFLCSCDLVPPPYPAGFDRFLRRYITPLYKITLFSPSN